MQAKQRSLIGPRTRVFGVTFFVLSIYLLLAVLGVGRQLPAFGTSSGHNASEVIHLQTRGAVGAQQSSVPDTAVEPHSAELRAKSEQELGISPDQSRSEIGKIGLSISWIGPHSTSRSSSGIEDQLSASHALWRWHRTVVLII